MEYIRTMLVMVVVLLPIISAAKVVKLDGFPFGEMAAGPASLINMKDTISEMMKARETTEKDFKQGSEKPLKRMTDPYSYSGPAFLINMKDTISKMMKARETKEKDFKQGSEKPLKRMTDPYSYSGPASLINMKDTISKMMKARETKEKDFKQGSEKPLKRMTDPYSYSGPASLMSMKDTISKMMKARETKEKDFKQGSEKPLKRMTDPYSYSGPASLINMKDTISKMMKARETKEKDFKQGSEKALKRMTDPYSYSGCHDTHVHCESWAFSGECTNNPVYMLENCPYSCGMPCISSCYDTDTHCREWANQGECFINPEYMIPHCQESCGACLYYKRDVTKSLDHVSPGTKADSVKKLSNEEKLKRALNFGNLFSGRETSFHAAGLNFKRDVTKSLDHGSPGTKADSVKKLSNEEKLKRALNFGNLFNGRETWFHAAGLNFKRDVTKSLDHGSPGTKADSVKKLSNEEKLKRALNFGNLFSGRETWFHAAGKNGPPGTR
ncbi:uncharacterized protein LOC117342257 isoform X11 [Pecten maximus]|uniref:uncharacterized protein LOC117342257 isoform X11 n=1 Tax=Pecten maximus TaxID=6579 RepID=UPI001458AB67|nr:uncharacterized protein LOC117342257 isoform X11 [Pecten maximus]